MDHAAEACGAKAKQPQINAARQQTLNHFLTVSGQQAPTPKGMFRDPARR